uniref:aspartate 4-decarboxylase n=1 Tax=uncultured Duncaniella sp. TaxID=2768039 RepID=UPI002664F8DE
MKNDKISPENRDLEKRLKQMSPFEIKNRLIEMAQTDARNSTATFLNAGRGNPNWIATEPREAFFLLGKFGLEECRRVTYNPVGIAGIPSEDGIGERFRKFLDYNKEERGAALISRTFEYLVSKHEFDPDILAHEFAEAVIGDQYPTPDRILKSAESMVRDYLRLAMGGGDDKSTYDLFATEGGTAGMCYAFDSIQENKLISKGDKMALMVPAFTPYIEIPHLDRFGFDVVNINADKVQHDGYHTWQYPKEEVDKLRDPSIKLLCVINPSNPPSYTLAPDTLQQLIDIVKNDNPNLMIITDDVYGTFIPHFRSLMAELPHNTLCVYSFSKYFGATGWRNAVIALHEDNIYDKMIARLSEEQKAILNKRYSSIDLHPEKLKFIDRMVADSRQIALNHTAGLSLPQQMQMSLFSLFAILDKENRYKTRMQEIIHRRLHALWDNTGFTLVEDPLRAGYYSEIDMLVWAKKFYGDDFVAYLQKTYNPLDVVFRLANETSLVLLNGGGFAGPKWSVRVSLANLNEADYVKIGQSIKRVLEEYA